MAYLAATLVAFVALFAACRFAPDGYQDELGFHYGKPRKNASCDFTEPSPSGRTDGQPVVTDPPFTSDRQTTRSVGVTPQPKGLGAARSFDHLLHLAEVNNG